MIKLPILVEFFGQVEDGRWRLDQPREVRLVDHVGGSGLLRHMTPGIFLTLRDLAYLMIAVSDNTATNMLIDLVGLANVNSRMRAVGCPHLVLRHPIDFDHAWTEPEHLAIGTPEEFVDLIGKLWKGDILGEASRADMFRMMAGVGADRAGRWLPVNPYGPEMARHGFDTRGTVSFAGKTGGLVGVRGQVAVISNESLTYAVAIMTTGARDLSWGVDSEGSLFAARLGKLLHEYEVMCNE
jgi:beta-lactamase class A